MREREREREKRGRRREKMDSYRLGKKNQHLRNAAAVNIVKDIKFEESRTN